MPFGLISHNLSFFSKDNVSNLQAPDDYKVWSETMYTLFGNKWASMHLGSMWNCAKQDETETLNNPTDIPSSALEDTLGSNNRSVAEQPCDLQNNLPVTQTELNIDISEQCSSPVNDILSLALKETFGPELFYLTCQPEGETPPCNNLQNDGTVTMHPTKQNHDTSTSVNNVLHRSLNDPGQSDNQQTPIRYEDPLSEKINSSNIMTSTPAIDKSKGQPSSLWSTLTQCEQREQEGSLSAYNLEEIIGMRPATNTSCTTDRNPLKAKVNIAGPSARTIRRTIEQNSFTKGTEIQVSALQHLKKVCSGGRWWIKADGTDLQSGLRESMRNEWSGDVDWGDGVLGEKHRAYLRYLEFIRTIGTKNRRAHQHIKSDLKIQLRNLSDEKIFLNESSERAKTIYEQKRSLLVVSEETLFALAWDVKGYAKLVEKNEAFSQRINNIIEQLDGPPMGRNVMTDLSVLKKQLQEYVKGVTTKKREAASHLLLFMVSDELRNFKPYAIPVRVIKYKSITDAKLRQLKNELREVMKSMGMITVGFVTDGEFNSLRTQGTNRSVSVIQLIMDAKAEARALSAREIEPFFKLVRGNDGVPTVVHHPAIPAEDVH